MSAKKDVFTKGGVLAAGAMLAMIAFGPSALANPVRISFSAPGASGEVNLTTAADSNMSSSYQPTYTSGSSGTISSSDPEGAQYITDANGHFSDTALGITNASIVGVKTTSPGFPPPGETLPASYSALGVPAFGPPGHQSTAVSYDNLFYAGGSPLVCPPVGAHPYTFHGGFLDIFGAMFALNDNAGHTFYLDLWSAGVTSPGFYFPTWPGGLTYGFNVIQKVDGVYTVTASQPFGVAAAVPAPDFVWLFGAGLLGLFAWRLALERRRDKQEV